MPFSVLLIDVDNYFSNKKREDFPFHSIILYFTVFFSKKFHVKNDYKYKPICTNMITFSTHPIVV